MVYSGNVSEGLLKLPGDLWVYRPGAGWSAVEAVGVVDTDDPQGRGLVKPFGRVHSTLVMTADRGLHLFGGESNRPYMYHNSVFRVSLA